MSQFRIAVCEDEPRDQEHLTQLIEEIFSTPEFEVLEPEVTCFTTADALRSEMDGGSCRFDAFLLDIQMPGMSGLDLARWIFEQGVRDRVIFITGYAEYALEGYDAHPLHYLLKPVDRDALASALALAKDAAHPQTVQLKRGGRTATLPVDDIRYIESRDHVVVVYLSDSKRSYPISLTEVERLLPAGMFARCHKSFLVNLAWVEECGRTEVRLRGGVHLPATRTFYRDFQAALVRWLNRKPQ